VAQRSSIAIVAASGVLAVQQARRLGASPGVLCAILAAAALVGFAAWMFWRRRQSTQQHAPA
jgi:ABC-type nickel/cobalt efflux system permease component RcnA